MIYRMAVVGTGNNDDTRLERENLYYDKKKNELTEKNVREFIFNESVSILGIMNLAQYQHLKHDKDQLMTECIKYGDAKFNLSIDKTSLYCVAEIDETKNEVTKLHYANTSVDLKNPLKIGNDDFITITDAIKKGNLNTPEENSYLYEQAQYLYDDLKSASMNIAKEAPTMFLDCAKLVYERLQRECDGSSVPFSMNS